MRIAIVAGEASGDQLAGGLVMALRRAGVEPRVEGIFGAEVESLGFTSSYPMHRLSVMGLTETAARYAELFPMRARLCANWLRNPPDVFVGIDAPDFNISLERRLREAGIRTVHYVSPSVWAWRRYRIHKIARAVDRMLTLFPFEADFYREHNVPVTFVGHPLADRIPMHTDRHRCRRELGLEHDGEVLALLPGSRMSEVSQLARPMLQTAAWLHARRPGLRFVVPLVDGVTRECFETALSEYGGRLPLGIVSGQSRLAMGAADMVLLASGTATLEAMLLKRPMVIVYRMKLLTYLMMRTMLTVKHAGLPNILAGRTLVPELLQWDAVPERMGPAVLRGLDDSDGRAALTREFNVLHAALRGGASERAARAVMEVVASS